MNSSTNGNFYSRFLKALELGDLERRTSFVNGAQQIIQNGKVVTAMGASLETPMEAPDLIETIKPEPHLFIFGAGHVSKALYDLAMLQGMKVTVADERGEVCTQDRFPRATRIVMPYEKILKTDFPVCAPYYVIVTHGHSYDSKCLEYALNHRSSYIGMIGSKGKVAATMEKMKALGYEESALERVHSPIGLKIGAVTPEEITVSIMAEVISVFRTDKNLVTINPDIVRTMASKAGVDVRIVEKHGSAPRSIGSQLFVEEDGTLHGTIGGGAIEKKSIEIAKSMMKEKKAYHLEDFSLDASSDLGMICGGQAKVIFTFLKK